MHAVFSHTCGGVGHISLAQEALEHTVLIALHLPPSPPPLKEKEAHRIRPCRVASGFFDAALGQAWASAEYAIPALFSPDPWRLLIFIFKIFEKFWFSLP